MVTPVENLRDLLTRYDAPKDEASDVAAVLALIEDGLETLSADHFLPGHVTASAFVVDHSKARLLLIHHAKLGEWLQPGGHVDDGEDVLTAAIREVREETGVEGIPLIDGLFDVDVHPIPESDGRPSHNHYDVRFLLQAVGEGLVESDEVLGVRWVPIAEVASVASDRSVLRAAAKLA